MGSNVAVYANRGRRIVRDWADVTCQPSSGFPSKLSKDNLARSVSKAHGEVREQQQRNPASYSAGIQAMGTTYTKDPDADSDEEMTGEANAEIWKLLPQLHGVPEATLKKLPLSAIFQLSNALAKSSKIADKMSVSSRLAQNAQLLLKNPVTIAAGTDNRRTVLHEGRFLGGACCSMADIWLKGREIVGPKGSTPVSSYDLDTIGCGGCVTARGWKEIHDPSSQELRLKHFYLPNVAGASVSSKKVTVGESGEEFCIGESLKEIGDLDGYRGALNSMREAMASALPWNRSVSAIVGFMCNFNWKILFIYEIITFTFCIYYCI